MLKSWRYTRKNLRKILSKIGKKKRVSGKKIRWEKKAK